MCGPTQCHSRTRNTDHGRLFNKKSSIQGDSRIVIRLNRSILTDNCWWSMVRKQRIETRSAIHLAYATAKGAILSVCWCRGAVYRIEMPIYTATTHQMFTNWYLLEIMSMYIVQIAHSEKAATPNKITWKQ